MKSTINCWREFSNFAKLHKKPDKCVNLGKMLHDVSSPWTEISLSNQNCVGGNFAPARERGRGLNIYIDDNAIVSIPRNCYLQKNFAALRFISAYSCVQLWQIELYSVG
jgi:hypothetical protein